MKKIIEIEGMMCMHCAAAVEKALLETSTQKVKIDLKKKIAKVETEADDQTLTTAIENVGYKVISIK
jgi:Cu+-exporting ATPase